MHARRYAVIVVTILCALSALADSELNLPGNRTVEATGPGGAFVDYNASGSGIGDDENGRPLTRANCSPASGSLFALGTTIVTCSAGDPPATGTFEITVVDTTAPTLTVPRTIKAEATSNDGASVTFQATATDIVDGNVNVVCSPSSGSTFPLGTTTVNCTASDSHGNSESDAFEIFVFHDTPPPPPPIDELPDITVAATSPDGAIVTFDVASESDDHNGRPRQADCTPASGSLFAVGTTLVTCTFTDKLGQTHIGTFNVTVTPFNPAAPTLHLPADISVEATSADGATVSYTATATDSHGNPIAIVCSPPSGATFPIGTTTVVCSATDSGETTTGTFAVTVTPASFPVITRITATPNVLSPPNHKLIDVTITVEASDSGNGPLIKRIYDVTSNEPVIGPGSGNTEYDWRITGDLTLELRAERSGQGDGRVYTVWVEVIDADSNRVTGSTTVSVPKGSDSQTAPVTSAPPARRRAGG